VLQSQGRPALAFHAASLFIYFARKPIFCVAQFFDGSILSDNSVDTGGIIAVYDNTLRVHYP